MNAAIIGREAELEVVRSFLESPLDAARALVLEGDAGIGKTTLWRNGVETARAQHGCVLVASPSGAEARLSFAAASDLLGDVLDDALQHLPPPQQRALRIALLLEEAEGAPPEPRAIATAFLGVVRALARTERLVIAVDDVQWLDGPSASALEFAIRRLGSEPISFLLARRTEEANTPLPLGLSRALPDDRLRRLHLGPFSLGALHRLLHERLELTLSRSTLRRIHETSGGNPFYALELARALKARGEPLDPGQPMPVPAELQTLITNRLATLPAETREALVAVAALSEPTTPLVQAAAAADLDPAAVAHVIEVENDSIRFTHPLFAAAVLSSASPALRRDVHRRLAVLVPETEARARHLALAAEGPDEEIAVSLEGAASHARARGAAAAAAELSEQALWLTPLDRPDADHRRRMTAAWDRFSAGDTARARTLVEDVLASAQSGRLRAEALAALARLHRYEGNQPAAAELAGRALTEPEADARVRAQAADELAAALFFMREDLENAHRHAALAADLAAREHEPGLRASSLGTKAIVEILLGHPDAASTIETASELDDRASGTGLLMSPSFAQGACFLWTDRVEEAALIFRGFHEAAVRRGDESSVPLTLANLALAEYLGGRWHEALRIANEANESAIQTGQRTHHAYSLGTRALIQASAGRETEARADADAALALAGPRGMAVARIHARWALGLLELSLDRPAETTRLLAPLREGLVAAGVREPGTVRFVPDEIEAHIALGHLDEAETLIGWLEEHARAVDRASALAAAHRARALSAAAQGDLEAALDGLEKALCEHDRIAIPFDRARTLLARGATQRRAKQKRAARESLAEAVAIFDALGATLWSVKARGELARIGGRAPSRGELTPTEERVAALVAEGRTNREVAAALFVTDRTIEFHLSRIYAKLGVRSRAELARRF